MAFNKCQKVAFLKIQEVVKTIEERIRAHNSEAIYPDDQLR